MSDDDGVAYYEDGAPHFLPNRILDAVRALHVPDETGDWCVWDGFSYPCETVRVLDLEAKP